MNKLIITITFLLLFNLLAKSQDFSKCKVDFSLLAYKASLTREDEGREFVFVNKYFPKYEYTSSQNKSISALKDELKNKLIDNKNYNKDNSVIKDSLNQHYTALINKESFIKIVWKEYIGEASKEELKALKNNKKLPNNLLTNSDYSFYIESIVSQIEEGKVIGNELSSSLSNYGFNNVEDATSRINEIKAMQDIIVVNGQHKYKFRERNISKFDPLFIIGKRDTIIDGGNRTNVEPRFTYYNNFTLIQVPVIQRPIFEAEELDGKKLVMKRSDPLTFTMNETQLITLSNFNFSENEFGNKQNKSVQLLYESERLSRVNSMLTELKSKKLTIKIGEELYSNSTVSQLNFLFNGIEIIFESNNNKISHIFNSKINTEIQYNSGYNRSMSTIPIYNFPIYYSDCYNKEQELYNNMTLPKDKINDEKLKASLLTSAQNSTLWMNYKIEKLILTNESAWIVETSKYTGLQKSRIIFADIYYKSTRTNKCYYETVYFSQKLDPFNQFNYLINVGEPALQTIYPCNLK